MKININLMVQWKVHGSIFYFTNGSCIHCIPTILQFVLYQFLKEKILILFPSYVLSNMC